MAAPTGWHVRCILHGIQNNEELDECATLLRGIAALYGDGFDFSVSPLASETILQHIVVSWSLPPADEEAALTSPIIRMLCTHDGTSDEIIAIGRTQIAGALRAVLERQLHGSDIILGCSIAKEPPTAATQPPESTPIKIFVSGDRSQVGKSTCCLGLVGSLLTLGYLPSEIAYIKPATQCEQPQLIAKFCRHHGIECCDIGPIVFYSGFTREFLKGTTESSQELLAKARAKVEQVGRGKKIVVVDGVGYPAVGSICGVSNASVASAVEAPVVLVGKRGVGDAVDSFNLNACFFESHGVHVLGAIFNRLPLDGYYSLENCRDSVMQYFQQYQPDKCVYGFIPELAEPSETDAMLVDDACCDAANASSTHMTKEEERRAHQVITLFSQSVNVAQLVDDATSFHFSPTKPTINRQPALTPVNKRPAVVQGTNASKRSRQDIQDAAKASGAAGG